MNEQTTVGIDLGTTNSLVGAIVEGRVRLFADAEGNDLLPSAVSGDGDRGFLVGRPARNRRSIDPLGTVLSIKRKMGEDLRVQVGGRELSPPQVSAMILRALLDRAERTLGHRPTRAVITVPAYFDDAQRQATKDAGDLAGLTVERLVNEPTAAAMTYQTGQEERVLVYDLGGGTFDVSVLDRDQGFLEVRASRGDTHLGGDDLDRALADLVLERLGASGALVETDPRAMARLLEAVERAKIGLSNREEVHLFDPYLAGEGAKAVHLDVELTRADVEAVATPFIARTLTCIDHALRDARLEPSGLDRVLLVGGASKMPIVSAMVSEHLRRPAHADLDADRAVAVGASLLAGRMSGHAVDEVLVDITPHTLSVAVAPRVEGLEGVQPDDEDLRAVPVIPRDTVVPVRRTKTVMTMVENQSMLKVPVVQGESERAVDNTWLGEVTVHDLPPSPVNSPVEVSFRLDLSGVLQVSARHVPSGREASVEIADSPYRLTAQRREAARTELSALVVHGDSAPDRDRGDLDLANALLARARLALEAAVPDASARDRVVAAAEALTRAVEDPTAALDAPVDDLSDALLDLA